LLSQFLEVEAAEFGAEGLGGLAGFDGEEKVLGKLNHDLYLARFEFKRSGVVNVTLNGVEAPGGLQRVFPISTWRFDSAQRDTISVKI